MEMSTHGNNTLSSSVNHNHCSLESYCTGQEKSGESNEKHTLMLATIFKCLSWSSSPNLKIPQPSILGSQSTELVWRIQEMDRVTIICKILESGVTLSSRPLFGSSNTGNCHLDAFLRFMTNWCSVELSSSAVNKSIVTSNWILLWKTGIVYQFLLNVPWPLNIETSAFY